MPDYGQRATDAEFRRLRAKINDVYQQAYKEVEQKGREFAQGHAKREAQMRQMVADGKMTQADFDAWMRGQVFQGKQWQKKRQQMADTLYHADQVAQQMVNDSRFNVFVANANYMGYKLEHDAGIKTNFGLYDANSVKKLVKKEPDLLPPKKMVGKDKSYRWYNKQVQSAITQGIIQGESLDKIAHRIGKQTGESSMTAMLRNARTMQTGAQNAGRIEGLHQAQELGIKVQKQWMATLDSHTRDTHADLDGQIVDVDEPFITTAGNEIMYPGDPEAAPEEVWNCRCTLIYVYPEYPNYMERRDNETGENVGDMTYREWEEMKSVTLNSPNSFGEKAIPYRDRGIDIDERYTSMMSDLQRSGDYIMGDPDSYTNNDLAVLSHETGVEYTKITAGGKTYIVRGEETQTDIPSTLVKTLIQTRGTVDAHSHPFIGDLVPSGSDKNMLKLLPWQKESVIIEPTGRSITFTREGASSGVSDSKGRAEHYYDDIWK